MTPTEKKLTKLAREVSLRQLGISDGYANNPLYVELVHNAFRQHPAQYRPVAANSYGRPLGSTAEEAEATLRELAP